MEVVELCHYARIPTRQGGQSLAESGPSAVDLRHVVASAVKQRYTMAVAMGRGADNMPMLADAVANFDGVTIQPESARSGKKKAKKAAKKKAKKAKKK